MAFTLNAFKNHLYFEKIGYGTFRVYWCISRSLYRVGISHDTLAVDRINSEASARARLYGYTLLQAYVALYSCVGSEFHKH